MPEPVPVLPVVVPLGVVVFAVLVGVLVARRRFSWPRASVAAALAVYAAGIVANTVFPVFLGRPTQDGPRLLPLVLVPFADYEVADAVTNVLVFVPLGVLVSLLLTRPTWWRVLLAAASVSAASRSHNSSLPTSPGAATSQTSTTGCGTRSVGSSGTPRTRRSHDCASPHRSSSGSDGGPQRTSMPITRTDQDHRRTGGAWRARPAPPVRQSCGTAAAACSYRPVASSLSTSCSSPSCVVSTLRSIAP